MQNLNTYLEDKLSEAICNLLFEDKWLKTNKKFKAKIKYEGALFMDNVTYKNFLKFCIKHNFYCFEFYRRIRLGEKLKSEAEEILNSTNNYNNLYLLIENLIVSYFRNRIYEQNEN